MESYLSEKVAFITGGSRGMGRSIALRLAKAGAKVAVCARKEESLQKVVEELKKIHPDILGFRADISHRAEVEHCVQSIQDAWGSIDILINNAGIYRYASVLETTSAMWDAQFESNLKGPFLVTRAVIPAMMERKKGCIIFISSTIAVISPPLNSCYAATKWGLEGFAGSIAQELCEHGIKVHVLRPGFTDTSIFDEIQKPDWEIDWIDPEEIAGAVEFLLRLPEHAQVPELTYMTTFQRKDH